MFRGVGALVIMYGGEAEFKRSGLGSAAGNQNFRGLRFQVKLLCFVGCDVFELRMQPGFQNQMLHAC